MIISKHPLPLILFTALMMLSPPLSLSAKASQSDLEQIFKAADIIPDNKLDHGEFDIYHYNAFKLMDANRDGLLMKDECQDGCFQWEGPTNREEPEKTGEIYRNHEFLYTDYRFDAIDRDQNGTLNIYEYLLFGRERFPHFDLDQNGMIEESEFCSSYRSSMPCDTAARDFSSQSQKQKQEH